MKRRQKLKWKFAIGTTSLVPSSVIEIGCWPLLRQHYIIADIDQDNVAPAVDFLLHQMPSADIACFPTKRGWHIYTDCFMPWRNAMNFIRSIPDVDQNWIRIGEQRGYLFLADKKLVELDWPVRRMVIYAKKKRHAR